MNTIEGNKLIAEFMGYTNNFWYHNNQLYYHSNWEWFMPVVKKINKLFDEYYFPLSVSDNYESMLNWIKDVNIENAFGDAATIIQWHNKRKSNSPKESNPQNKQP